MIHRGGLAVGNPHHVLVPLPGHKLRHLAVKLKLHMAKGAPVLVIGQVLDELAVPVRHLRLAFAERHPGGVHHRQVVPQGAHQFHKAMIQDLNQAGIVILLGVLFRHQHVHGGLSPASLYRSDLTNGSGTPQLNFCNGATDRAKTRRWGKGRSPRFLPAGVRIRDRLNGHLSRWCYGHSRCPPPRVPGSSADPAGCCFDTP
jgi:hypothetical protein